MNDTYGNDSHMHISYHPPSRFPPPLLEEGGRFLSFFCLYFPSGGNLCIPSARLLHSHSGLITIFPVMGWRKETTDEDKKGTRNFFLFLIFEVNKYLAIYHLLIFSLPWSGITYSKCLDQIKPPRFPALNCCHPQSNWAIKWLIESNSRYKLGSVRGTFFRS